MKSLVPRHLGHQSFLRLFLRLPSFVCMVEASKRCRTAPATCPVGTNQQILTLNTFGVWTSIPLMTGARASLAIDRSRKSRKQIKLIATGVENASQKFRGIVYDRALKVNRWWYVFYASCCNASYLSYYLTSPYNQTGGNDRGLILWSTKFNMAILILITDCNGIMAICMYAMLCIYTKKTVQ